MPIHPRVPIEVVSEKRCSHQCFADLVSEARRTHMPCLTPRSVFAVSFSKLHRGGWKAEGAMEKKAALPNLRRRPKPRKLPSPCSLTAGGEVLLQGCVVIIDLGFCHSREPKRSTNVCVRSLGHVLGP